MWFKGHTDLQLEKLCLGSTVSSSFVGYEEIKVL